MRLNKRHKALSKRGLHHNKTKVAVARELVSFIWELGTKMEAKHTADSKETGTRRYELK